MTSAGRSDFHALQEAIKTADDAEIVYLVFDLMNYEGFDIRSAPLSERKALLAELVPHAGKVRYADHVVGQGREFFRAACEQKLEGILSKQLDSEYLSQRTRSWVKVKCEQRQEFVVGGYTESGAGRPFGSLLAGCYADDGRLVFVGKIKSGYSVSLCESLLQTMAPYHQANPPFVNPPSGEEYRNPNWLRPELVAEVAFSGISGSGLLRHASFKGMREDKPAREVRLEVPEALAETSPQPSPPPLYQRERGAKHPSGPPLGPSPLPLGEGARRAGEGGASQEGVPQSAAPSPPPLSQRAREANQPVFPHERIGREEVVAYYRLVAERMLPHLADRPLTLIMCRTNIYACSFKKHATNLPPPVKGVDAGHEERYIAIDSAAGLETLVSHGVVEFHAWQSRYTDLEHPDRMLFDLDPPEDDSLPWERLAEAALLLRIHLQEHGLESYLQATGGKGYYLVAPLTPSATWGAMTGFAKRVAREMELKFPDRFTAQLEKEKRGGRIYVDWMRNGRGANAAEPYSLRARPGAPVSAPITWEELVAGATPASFNLRNMAERLEGMQHDPWEGYFELRQKLPGEGPGTAGKGPLT